MNRTQKTAMEVAAQVDQHFREGDALCPAALAEILRSLPDGSAARIQSVELSCRAVSAEYAFVIHVRMPMDS